jgi:cation transporter-like permease
MFGLIMNDLSKGLIGNMASVYACRYSTALHGGFEETHATTQLILFMLNFPIQWIFVAVMHVVGGRHIYVNPSFMLMYTIVSTLMVPLYRHHLSILLHNAFSQRS